MVALGAQPKGQYAHDHIGHLTIYAVVRYLHYRKD